MSILLNALNKSKDQEILPEGIDDMIDTPIDEEFSSHYESDQKPKPWLMMVLVIIAVLLLAILSLLIFDRMSLSNSEVDVVQEPVFAQVVPQTKEIKQEPVQPKAENKPVAVEPKSSSEQSASDKQQQYFEQFNLQSAATKPPSVSTNRKKVENKQQQQENQSTKTVKNTSSLNTSLQLKEESDLTDVEALMVKEVIIEAHVFSEQASERFVFIQGRLVQESEKLINSWYLEEVEENAIIINNGVLRVRKKIN